MVGRELLLLGADGGAVLRMHFRWLAIRHVFVHRRKPNQYRVVRVEEVFEANKIRMVQHCSGGESSVKKNLGAPFGSTDTTYHDEDEALVLRRPSMAYQKKAATLLQSPAYGES